MIRAVPKAHRARQRYLARRQWRRVFVPLALIRVEGFGRAIVCMRRLDTRWSDQHQRQLWRLPVEHIGAAR